MANTASLVMPQQPLHLLQEYLMLQDKRRLEAAAAAGGVVSSIWPAAALICCMYGSMYVFVSIITCMRSGIIALIVEMS
jgi:hypothetical protein